VSITEGIPKSLETLLSDKDAFCRYKSAECLFVLSCNFNGRKAIVDQGIIKALSILFDDKEEMARINSHKTVQMVSELPYGSNGIIELSLIKKLVDKLNTEIEDIKELILDTLHFCMQIETKQALDAKAMVIFTKLLEHTSNSIRSKAARDIFDLRFSI
jgi:hypothetical protein